MSKVKKTINLGGITLTIEVDEPKAVAVPQSQTRTRSAMPIAPNREPDGFDAHIDRPLRENYRGDWFASQKAFDTDMRKYREAERAVKACNWPTREPMGNGIPQWPVPQPMAPHSGVLVEESRPRTPQPSVVKSTAWNTERPTRRGVEKEVKFASGRVPLGAVVVGHTFDGEPIFTIR